MASQEYVLLSSVDFGVLRDDKGNVKNEDNRVLKGVHAEGSTLTLDADTAAPLLKSGAIRLSSQDNPFATDRPEEHGYAGQSMREEAQKQETQTETAGGTSKRKK